MTFEMFNGVLPDFLIIGVQKGGTTSLYRYLVQHKDVAPCRNKEVKYFHKNYARGNDWYRKHFPKKLYMSLTGKITGEASADYLTHPPVPGMVKQLLPDIKLIVLLRDPIDRIYSHYHYRIKRKIESRPIEVAIEADFEAVDKAGEDLWSDPNIYASYLARSLYAVQLERWFAHFNRSQMLILSAEQMFNNPNSTLSEVQKFLELKKHEISDHTVFNSGEYSTTMPQALVNQLKSFYAPHNKKLYKLLGREFGWGY